MNQYDTQELSQEIENGIRARLDRTEIWARENFTGPEDELEDFIMNARNYVLAGIGEKVRDHCKIAMTPLGNMDN